MKLKVCGLTRVQDVKAVCLLGAFAVGFIFVPESSRCVSVTDAIDLRNAVSGETLATGVFQDHSLDEVSRIVHTVGLDGVQLHGSESVDYCRELREKFPSLFLMKTLFHFSSQDMRSSYGSICDAILFDTPRTHVQTSRQPIDFAAVAAIATDVPYFVAGGLNAVNVKEVLRGRLPMGVDVCSGIESFPGAKSEALLKSFFLAVKECL